MGFYEIQNCSPRKITKTKVVFLRVSFILFWRVFWIKEIVYDALNVKYN